jgi:hypothetical protein
LLNYLSAISLAAILFVFGHMCTDKHSTSLIQ